MPAASWTITAHAENIAFVRQAVMDFLADHGIDERRLTDLRLAVSEAVTNAVVHAFRDRREPGTVEMRVCLSADGREVEILVRDDGIGMARRPDSPGLGLGLPLMRHLADQFDHREHPDGGAEVRMRFRL